MPQTTFTNYHAAAIAGQVVDGADGKRKIRGRYESSENLSFGRIVELHTDGKLRAPQGTTLGKVIGGVPYNGALPPTNVNGTYVNGYAAGQDIVPVLRGGAMMWIPYTGTAPTVEAKPNIRHASSDANGEAQYRGTITGSATSATAGSEISAGPEGMVVVEVDTALGLALVEFNLPA